MNEMVALGGTAPAKNKSDRSYLIDVPPHQSTHFFRSPFGRTRIAFFGARFSCGNLVDQRKA